MVTSTGLLHRLMYNSPLDWTCIRGDRVKPKVGVRINVQKSPVPESYGASFARKPCLDTRTESHQGHRKSSGGASTSSTDSRKKESQGG